jgi:hypothetical protein
MQTNLDEVARSFSTWRSTREKRGHTPTHLKQQAVSLLGKHTSLAILSRLGINQRALTRWKLELSDVTPAKFIDITPDAPSVTVSASLSVAIDLRSGTQLTLSGNASDVASLLLSLQQGGGL